MRTRSTIGTLLLLLGFALSTFAAEWPDRTSLPIPLSPFSRKIDKPCKESEPNWSEQGAASKGTPNLVAIPADKAHGSSLIGKITMKFSMRVHIDSHGINELRVS